MQISLIWAMTKNRVIGQDGGLPWHLPDEIKYFRETTKGKPVIMGRKTFDSIGRNPLPGRTNIVVSKNIRISVKAGIPKVSAELQASSKQTNVRQSKAPSLDQPKILFAKRFDESIQLAKDSKADECFVLGGAEIYGQALPIAHRLYQTIIDAELEGDVFFPEFNAADWELVSTTLHDIDEKHRYRFKMMVLERR